MMTYSEMKDAIMKSMENLDFRTMRFIYCFLVGRGVISKTNE